jgi:hypothetical protein
MAGDEDIKNEKREIGRRSVERGKNGEKRREPEAEKSGTAGADNPGKDNTAQEANCRVIRRPGRRRHLIRIQSRIRE